MRISPKPNFVTVLYFMVKITHKTTFYIGGESPGLRRYKIKSA